MYSCNLELLACYGLTLLFNFVVSWKNSKKMYFWPYLTVFLALIVTKINGLDLNMYLQYVFMQFGAGSVHYVQLWYSILLFLQKIAKKMIFLPFLTVFLALIATKIIVLDLNTYLIYVFMQFGASSMHLVQLWCLILLFLLKIAQKWFFLPFLTVFLALTCT